MNTGLIDQLYSKEECDAIRKLYLDDEQVHDNLKEAIGNKLIVSKDKIVTTNLLDVLFLICLTSKFASSEDECYRVALNVYQYYDKASDLLPSIAFDRGLTFATKCLISLSFHAKALEVRWKFHGAPSPSFYRQTSKTIFTANQQKDIADHHELWEGFLGEMLV